MSMSIKASLLVFLVAVCLNFHGEVIGDSLESTPHFASLQNDSNISPDINILFVSISNDLPSSPTKLHLFADFQKSEVEIDHGNPYTRLLNMDAHTGSLRWNSCLVFSVYTPELDKGHNRIFWSAREDGAYRSWDSNTWERKEVWSVC